MGSVENIGSRRELFVDDFLIHSTTARLELRKPAKREICFRFDAPQDGTGNGYPVLIRDGPCFRLYYGALRLTSPDGTILYHGAEAEREHPPACCCIESDDGISWHRPSVGAVEFRGSRDNNIVFTKPGLDNFIPFLDTNPACPPEARYKAFEGGWKKLEAYQSADGYSWKPMGPLAISGSFDSSNLAFWDAQHRRYWAYVRDFHDVPGMDMNAGIRDIRVCESGDFRSWSAPELLDFGGAADIPLYVSAVTQYARAPHIFMGFPVRYVERTAWSPAYDQLPDPAHRRNRMGHHPRYGLALTDCLYMTSRDGKRWRRSDEAYLTPGIGGDSNWVYGDCYLCINMAETRAEVQGAPKELSMYAVENHWKGPPELRRYTIRQDGFMALSADARGHETLTRPFTFDGRRLSLNVATSAAGGMRVEMQDSSGRCIPRYSLSECDEVFGDRLDHVVSWNGSSDVSSLAGKPIRMRLAMRDVELYSFSFGS